MRYSAVRAATDDALEAKETITAAVTALLAKGIDPLVIVDAMIAANASLFALTRSRELFQPEQPLADSA